MSSTKSSSTIKTEDSDLTCYRNAVIALGTQEELLKTARGSKAQEIDWNIVCLRETISNLENLLKKTKSMLVSKETDIEGVYFLKKRGYNSATIKFAPKLDKDSIHRLLNYADGKNVVIW